MMTIFKTSHPKQVFYLILFSILFFSRGEIFSQEISQQQATAPNLKSTPAKASCALSAEYISKLGSVDLKEKLNGTFQKAFTTRTTNANVQMINCGRFRFTFTDVVNATGQGFDSPQGLDYINCVCAAANYFQSIFDIPVGDGSPIDIVFDESYSGLNPSPNQFSRTTGGPLFTTTDFVNNVPGFYGGNAFEHYTTGIDPDPLSPDGTITVDFSYGYFLCGESPSCYLYDFESAILHELTHVMGWTSLLKEDAGLNPVSLFGSNKYSIYDKRFLFYGDILTGNFQQIIDTNSITISTGLQSSCLRNKKLWYHNTPKHSFTDNQNFCVAANDPWIYPVLAAPNNISHIISDQTVFFEHSCNAPGFQPDYVMNFFIPPSIKLSGYAMQEIRALNKMGYQYSAAYLASNYSKTINHHPFTTKNIISSSWFLVPPFPATELIDDPGTTPADFRINNCETLSIKLSSDSNIIDIDSGDVKRIFPGSLYNIRGCGKGGNNHDCLTVLSLPDGDVILYKPRGNFTGRAQFGFELYDGKEKGAFMVYTIDVDPCEYNFPELVINGNFEEGMEVCNSTNYVPNATNRNLKNLYYVDGFGTMFPDGVKYIGYSATIVKNSYGCDPVNGAYGFPQHSFSSSGSSGIPASSIGGDRYFVNSQRMAYFGLYSAIQSCTRYTLEFDYCLFNTTSINSKFGFTEKPRPFNFNPQHFVNVDTFNISGPIGIWKHKRIAFNYCDTLSANFLVFRTQSSLTGDIFAIDNLSLIANTNDCQLCFNGAESELTESKSIFDVYPNPTNDHLFIEIENSSIGNQVEIYDAIGRRIYFNSDVNDLVEVGTQNFASGIIKIVVTGGDVIQAKSVIIEH